MNDSDNLLWPAAWLKLLGCEFGLNKHNDIAGSLAVALLLPAFGPMATAGPEPLSGDEAGQSGHLG